MPQGDGLSRREFLKLAGLSGATLTLGASLGGLLGACGEGASTTTTAGSPTTTGEAPTGGASGATVSTGPERGREVRIGCVVPKTGPLAAFASPFDYILERWNEAVAGGVVCGDGKLHPIKILTQDTQSDTNRCAQVTGDLIQNDKVDVIFAGGAPDTMNPAADQCEALECPGEMIQGPWQPFFFGRGGTPDKPFKWGYALCVGIEAMADCFVDLWNQIPTNKKVGLLYPNTTDGQAWGDEKQGGPFFFKQGGYEYTMPSFFQTGAEDFTAQISQFKKFGAEICSGACPSTDFTNFWKQCIQQGFRPKICTVGQALNFAETVTAIGPIAYGLTTEITWHPAYPYRSSLTGETCQEFADDYERRTGRQWSAELMVFALMEWFVDALKRTKNIDDKEELLAAIASAKVETIYGPVDFTMPVDPTATGAVTRPVHNCLRMPIGAGQWLKGEKWPFEKYLVSNKYVPGAQITRKVEEIKYES